MSQEKNKKISIRQRAVACFFVFLLSGLFLFGENVLAANDYTKATIATPIANTWNNTISNYDKPLNGTLSAFEWNGLAYDFVKTWATSTMVGPLGIGTTNPIAMFDVSGNLKITTGGSIYNMDNSRWLDMTGVLSDSLRVSGNLITTAGKVGIGTTAPNQQLEITKNFRMPSTLFTNGSYGVIYKDGNRFIHDFNYGNNGVVTTAGNNTFVGINSGNFTMGSTATSAGQASYNTAVGRATLTNNTTGYQNTAGGYNSLYNNTTGSNNTAYGIQTLLSNSTGSNNTANGVVSLYSSTVGANNTAIGYASLYTSVTGNNGVAIGYESQRYANSTTTAWTNTNTSVGYQALRGGTNASLNTGNYNSAFGFQTLINNTTGSNNTANGYGSLYSNTSGSTNTAIGYASMYYSTTGNNNTALGYASGRNLADGTTGRTAGNYGLYLGYGTKASTNNTDNEIVIGYNATGQGSNTAVYGNTSMVKHIFSNGNVGVGTTTPVGRLDVDGLIKMRNYTITQPEDVINKSYLDSALSSSTSEVITQIATSSLWQGSLTGSIYNNNSGNVGIGIANPAGALHVYGNASSSKILLGRAGVPNFQAVMDYSTPALYFGTLSSDSLYLMTNNISRLTIGSSGIVIINPGNDFNVDAGSLFVNSTSNNVGIGTTNPTSTLDIAGKVKVTSGGTIYNTDNGRYLDMTGVLTDSLKVSGDIYSTAGELKTDGMGVNYMMGSLGVGTAAPNGKLAVAQNMSDYGQAFSNPHIKLLSNDTIDNTGFVGITYAASSAINYGWSVGANRTSSAQSNFVWKYHSNDPVGVERMRINQVGNVGIGTTDPGTNKLYVNGTAYFSNSVSVGTPTAPSHAVTLSYLQSAIATTSDSALGFWTKASGKLYPTDTTLNVGVGTTNPQSKLSVHGASGDFSQFSLANSSGSQILNMGSVANTVGSFISNNSKYHSNYIFTPSYTAASGINFRQDGSTEFFNDSGLTSGIDYLPTKRMVILNNGNVGIGTTAPAASLDIYGKVKTTSGGTIYNTDSSRYLDMTGTLTDSLKVSGDLYSTAGELKTDGTGINYMMGSVGIGTIAPQAGMKVDVRSNPNIDGSSAITAYGYNGNGGIAIKGRGYATSGTGNNYAIYGQSDGSRATGVNIGGYFTASGAVNNYALITGLGNVGIGITNPSYKLEVSGGIRAISVGSQLRLTYSGGAYPNFDFSVNSNGDMGLSGGNVGIGTTTPTAKLHVVGDAIVGSNNGTRTLLSSNGGIEEYYGTEVTPRWKLQRDVLNGSRPALIFGTGAGSAAFGSPTSAALGMYTAGAERVRIDGSGNVGINTTTPDYKLDVNGAAQFNQPVIVGTPTANNHAVTKSYVDSAAAAVGGGVGTGTSGQTLRNNGTSWVANSLLFNNGINVGIGTTNPQTLLDLGSAYGSGNAARKLSVYNDGTYFFGFGVSLNTLEFSAKGTSGAAPQMVLKDTGNVGIGTTGPSAKLDVEASSSDVGPWILAAGGSSVFDNVGLRLYDQGTGEGNSNIIEFAHNSSGPVVTARILSDSVGSSAASGSNLIFETASNNTGTWNSNQLFLSRGGNIGIGTTGSGAKLHVSAGQYKDVLIGSGGAIGAPDLSVLGASVLLTRTNTQYADSGIAVYTSTDGGNNLAIKARSDVVFVSGNSNDERMRIKELGNVGIGTVSPAYKLDVNGTAQFNQPVIVGTPTANNHAVTKSYLDSALDGGSGSTVGYWAMNGTNISNTNTGNVGIGTTTASYKMEVSGTFNATASSSSITLDADGNVMIGI